MAADCSWIVLTIESDMPLMTWSTTASITLPSSSMSPPACKLVTMLCLAVATYFYILRMVCSLNVFWTIVCVTLSALTFIPSGKPDTACFVFCSKSALLKLFIKALTSILEMQLIACVLTILTLLAPFLMLPPACAVYSKDYVLLA